MIVSLQPGDPAPDFEMSFAEGKRATLKDYAGKKLVLYFYPKDDTSGCTSQALAFEGLKGEFVRAGASILGVSPDGVKSHEKFKEKHGLTLKLAADEDKTTLITYGVWTEKSMYGRKYMGVERATFLIDTQGKIARVWRKVKVPGHAEDVLKAVRAL